MTALNIDFTRVNNDVNGNPRYVCHYLNFEPVNWDENNDKRFDYNEALHLAKKLGGRKFHNKQYGGGVVFQSYNIQDTIESIMLMTGEAVTYHRPPNAYELKMGYGATHYRTFLKSDVLNRKGELKKWFKADDDGLNYSRG